jgi:hypothetical protein
MHDVEELFPGVLCQTRVWTSAVVRNGIAEFCQANRRHGEQLLRSLRQYAVNGFALYEGDDRPIRHEGQHVYRIGRRISKFRIYGFYEDGTRRTFIAIDAFTKRGTKLSAAERGRVDTVARVRDNGLWRKTAPQ